MRKVLSAFVVSAVFAVAANQANGALLYATGTVSGNSVLSTFDSNALGAGAVTTVPVNGLAVGETLVGIDVRPAGGFSTTLYGLSSTSRLYIITPGAAAATVTPVGGPLSTLLSGNGYGFDFNPVADRLRSVSDLEQNLRINPITGALVNADTPLNNAAASIVATAYSNNFFGATTTTLYGIDAAAGSLVTIGSVNGTPNSPDSGIIANVGSLGLTGTPTAAIGFDIQGNSSTGFATITLSGITRLYSVNLSNGAATLASSNGGTIGTGAIPYVGLAATPAPEPGTFTMIGATAAGLLLRRRRAVRA